MQNTWIMPPAGRGGVARAGAATHVPPATVTVTLANGKKVDGQLGRIDDFIVTLTEDDGTAFTLSRVTAMCRKSRYTIRWPPTGS